MTEHSIHPSLKDKRVLITGGATGIGEAHVRAFAAQGARVAFLDIAAEAGEALAESLAGERHRPLFRRTDVTDLADLEAGIAEAVAEIGDIEVLVNNAANDTRHTLAEVTAESFDAGIAVNLRHVLFASKAVVPGMQRAGGGVIVNTGSISWRAGLSGIPVYVTAKAGIEGLTKGLAREFGPDRIRVNAIIPGWVMTERQVTLWFDDEGRKLLEANQCLPDLIEPADIARMATWLASDDSRMCTSQTFVVDGGWT